MVKVSTAEHSTSYNHWSDGSLLFTQRQQVNKFIRSRIYNSQIMKMVDLGSSDVIIIQQNDIQIYYNTLNNSVHFNACNNRPRSYKMKCVIFCIIFGRQFSQKKKIKEEIFSITFHCPQMNWEKMMACILFMPQMYFDPNSDPSLNASKVEKKGK